MFSKGAAHAAVAIVLAAIATSAGAAETWVVRGRVQVGQCPAFRVFVWVADAVLINTGTEAALVRLHPASGVSSAPAREMRIAPGESRSLAREFADVRPQPLWITRIEAPPHIAIDSRLEYDLLDCHFGPQAEVALGRLPIPVFRAITPAGERRVHTGTDLGNQDARVNVGILNASDAPATATIALHRTHCIGEAPIAETVSLAPRELRQVTMRDPRPVQCTGGSRTNPSVGEWVRYVTTTVDQPSLSYAVVLSNVAPPAVTVGFATPAQ